MYPRFVEQRIRDALTDTRVVLVSGPRQSGKTTLGRKLATGGMTYLTLDNATVLDAARSDPVGFVRGLDRAIIDEVQRAPGLMLALKESVDADRRPGRFLLTGSADLMLLPRVADSLAGRMEVMRLFPLAQCEIRGVNSGFLSAAFAGEVPHVAEAMVGHDLVTAVRLDTPANPTAADKSGYTLFSPTPDAALRTFSPDRPTKSNGPLTVDAGRIQYETDLVTYLHSNAGGVSTRTYVALDPTLKIGLTRRVDLELQFNGYTNTRVLDPGAGSTVSRADGAGDLVVRSKVNLFGNDGGAAAMALIPYVKIPTAERTLGNNQVEGGLIVPISMTLPAGFALVVMPEIDLLKNNNDGGQHVNLTGVVNLGYSIDKSLTVFGELYSAVGADSHTPPVYTADAAVAYLLTDSIQLDAGANFGLNRNAPNLQIYTGISQRF